jgi:hypothetical protein
MSLASINRIGKHVLISLVGMVVAVLAAYYILEEFIYPFKNPHLQSRELFQGIAQVRGTVTSIEHDDEAIGTTTVVFVTLGDTITKRIIVPHNPAVNCLSTNIFDPASLLVGDVVDIKGAAQADGGVFPCAETEHHAVKVVTAVPVEPEIETLAASSTATTTTAHIEVTL